MKKKSIHKVLIIDDDEWSSLYFTKMFGHKIYVDHAKNSIFAFRLLKKCKYDYVFIDFGLIGQNGLDAYHVLEPYLNESNVYIVSGFEKEYILGFKRDIDISGIKGFIHKNDFEKFIKDI